MKRQYNPSRWYRERNEMICADYERGTSVYELMMKWQMSEGRIRMILRRGKDDK